ncbi:N-acetyltransferase [Chiua virens]|nr:N-acetyltransferase [Chiua virens]
MNIRKVELNDLVRLLTCNISTLPENYMIRFWQYWLVNWPDLSFLAEDDHGKIVGFVLSSIEPDERETEMSVGHINSLSVLRPYRRLGLAQRLMNLSKDAILRAGVHVDYLQLHVRKSNRAAQSLYDKLGYKYHDTEKKYYSDDEDALVMRIPVDQKRRSRKTWLSRLLHIGQKKPPAVSEETLAFFRARGPQPASFT